MILKNSGFSTFQYKQKKTFKSQIEAIFLLHQFVTVLGAPGILTL